MEVYTLDRDQPSSLLHRIDTSLGMSIASTITALVYNPIMKHVYMSHESGKVAVHDVTTGGRERIVQVSNYKVLSMVVVVGRVWVGVQTGKILVFRIDGETDVWHCDLDFQAFANCGVFGLAVEGPMSQGKVGVLSVSDVGGMKVWDGCLREYCFGL